METSSLNVAECCLNVRTLTHLGAMRPEGVALTGIDTLTRLGRTASELSRSALFAFSGRRRQLGPVALKHVVARETPRPVSCGAKGTRTPDPLLAKQVLFQLSYSPKTAGQTANMVARLARSQ